MGDMVERILRTLVIDVYRWLWSVVTRHEEQKGFVVLPKRWHARENMIVGLIGADG